MSLVEHLGHIGHTPMVHCAECGDVIRRKDAFLIDGEAFCCVLHEVEHSLGAI